MDQLLNMYKQMDQGHTYSCYCYHCVPSLKKNALPVLNSKYEMKIRDMTDYDMYIMDVNNKNVMIANANKVWDEYKKKNELKRPYGHVDMIIDGMNSRLEYKRNKLEDECKKVPVKTYKSYVPPSKRLEVVASDPKLIPLRKEIEILENEFKELEKKVAQEDAEWEQSAKYEFAIQNQMCEM